MPVHRADPLQDTSGTYLSPQSGRASDFYTALYPYKAKEDVFAGIKFFSIIKNGAALVSVFERSEGIPIYGTIPVLKVDSVSEYLTRLESMDANVIFGESVCPCTKTNFSLCADREGNQFIVKEPTR